ncbi:hypothetical protein V2J09_019189 [Rumex salicifolius]
MQSILVVCVRLFRNENSQLARGRDEVYEAWIKAGYVPSKWQLYQSKVKSELATDVTVVVDDTKFYLHKFPLLSKSSRLQKLILKANENNSDEIELVDCPGGPKSFEICAKFCYGMAVTLNPYNVVAARCAAEYLEMIEDVERGNLIFKIEVFLNSSILRSWKDSIIVLQTTKSYLPWAEDLKIIGRCIDSVASKTSMDTSKVTWSYTHNRKLAMTDGIVEHGIMDSVPKDWWVEDLCELDVDLYKRVMVAVNSKGRMDGPLLKATSLVEADESTREDLVEKISMRLDEASAHDLLIPAKSTQNTIYDVEMVQHIVKRFSMQDKYNQFEISEKTGTGTDNLDVRRGSWLSVGRLVDIYLAEVAHDPHLEVSSVVDLAQMIPDLARPIHDGLYRAIDIYLKEHPDLCKSDKKKLCGLMDVKRLSMEASTHAAQNDRLPLRLVVQVLYFEQVRSATGGTLNSSSHDMSNSTTSVDEEWENHHHLPPLNKAALQNCKSLRKQMDMVKLKDEEDGFPKSDKKIAKKGSKNSRSGIQLLPSRSRRIFDKLWVMGKGLAESKSSETSGSSLSPTSMAPGETKSSGSSSRRRRHSIS